MKTKLLVIACLTFVSAISFAAPTFAGLVNDVPSCYKATGITPPAQPYDNLLYVLVDQTVKLDPSLDQSVVDNTLRLVQPGTKIVLGTFSAFAQGRYLEIEHTEIVEKPLANDLVNSTAIQAAKNLAGCLRLQSGYASKMAATTLANDLNASSTSLDQSDILQALKTVAAPIAAEKSPNKTIFLVTDGLENSSVTSFYASNAIRLIDPKRELAKAATAHLVGDFGGAKVFILGGATMPATAEGTRAQKDGYRNPQMLRALGDFWEGYFKSANASLIEFGTPALVSPVSF